MNKIASRRLVVDSSVAQAAGNLLNLKQVCRPYQEFLRTMLEVCHRAVLTEELKEEWKHHAALFARTWLTQMFGRKKVVFVNASVVPNLQKRVEVSNPPDLDPEKIRKDLHLVYAAIQTDGLVASHDQEMKRRLAKALEKAPELRDLVWIDPSDSKASPIEWLKLGSPTDRRWTLSGIQPSSPSRRSG